MTLITLTTLMTLMTMVACDVSLVAMFTRIAGRKTQSNFLNLFTQNNAEGD